MKASCNKRRIDRPDQTRLTRPNPQTPPRAHRRCAGKRAPGAQKPNPTWIPKKEADKNVCASCSRLVEKKTPPPVANRAGRNPLPRSAHTLPPGGPEGQLEPPQSTPEGGRGRYVQNVWPQHKQQESEKQEGENRRPDKPRRPGRRRGIKQGRKKHKRRQKTETKHGTPTLRRPEQKCACVLTCSPEMASEKPTKNFQFPDSDHDKEGRKKKTIYPKIRQEMRT